MSSLPQYMELPAWDKVRQNYRNSILMEIRDRKSQIVKIISQEVEYKVVNGKRIHFCMGWFCYKNKQPVMPFSHDRQSSRDWTVF